MGKAKMPEGFQLKKPCKHCPFAPSKTRITFSGKERAEEIAEHAYRNGFPCHESATLDEDAEDAGFEFGKKTQHCAGAVMMFLADGNDSGWPGINNDEDLAERLSMHVDWTAPHYESERDFIEANDFN